VDELNIGAKLTFLNLRCVICDKVSQSDQSVEELIDVEAEDICMDCYICKECEKW
jgi:hypothetical protein